VARQGNDIGEVYATCFQRLVVQLYAVTGNLGEAQEVVQEAFIRALAAPARFDGLEKPEAWLRRVAVNLARSRHRRRLLAARLLGRIGPLPVVSPVSADHVALMAAIQKLPIGQRHAIALHYLADLPVDEVGRTLGVSVGTVKSLLSRGRYVLAAHLTDSADPTYVWSI
jgi:DNA-directed RNA polymerase specialized sigma24 family protein